MEQKPPERLERLLERDPWCVKCDLPMVAYTCNQKVTHTADCCCKGESYHFVCDYCEGLLPDVPDGVGGLDEWLS